MGQVSGVQGYLDKAKSLAALVDNNVTPTPSQYGEAAVWCHGLVAVNACHGAQPTNYVRYTVLAFVDLGLQGMDPFNQPGYLERVAHSVAAFMMDNGTTDMAPDIEGGVAREGIPPSGRERRSVVFYLPLSILTSFDQSGALVDDSNAVYDRVEPSRDNPDNMEIPAAMLLNATIN